MRLPWVVVFLGCNAASPAQPDGPPAPSNVRPLSGMPEDVLTGSGEPYDLALDATHVYFARFTDRDTGEILRVAKGGGAIESIVTGQRPPGRLDASGERVCWLFVGDHGADFTNGSVNCATKSGGAAQEISTAYLPTDLAVDNGRVYWVEGDGGRVRSSLLDGQDVQTIASSGTSKYSLTIDETRIGWTAGGTADWIADVVVMDRGSGEQDEISFSDYHADSLVFAGADVYWLSELSFYGEHAVRVSRDGARPEHFVRDELRPHSMLRVADTLYWASEQHVRAVTIEGGAAVTLVSQSFDLDGLVTDGEYLYWAEPDRGAIVRARL